MSSKTDVALASGAGRDRHPGVLQEPGQDRQAAAGTTQPEPGQDPIPRPHRGRDKPGRRYGLVG